MLPVFAEMADKLRAFWEDSIGDKQSAQIAAHQDLTRTVICSWHQISVSQNCVNQFSFNNQKAWYTVSNKSSPFNDMLNIARVI